MGAWFRGWIRGWQDLLKKVVCFSPTVWMDQSFFRHCSILLPDLGGCATTLGGCTATGALKEMPLLLGNANLGEVSHQCS